MERQRTSTYLAAMISGAVARCTWDAIFHGQRVTPTVTAQRGHARIGTGAA